MPKDSPESTGEKTSSSLPYVLFMNSSASAWQRLLEELGVSSFLLRAAANRAKLGQQFRGREDDS